MDVADDEHIDHVEQRQDKTRNDRGEEDLADRYVRVGAHRDEHDGRRNENAERAAGTDHAARQRRLVAALEQDRYGQHAHRNNGRADDAGRGGEHRGNHDDRQTETALQRTEQVANGEEQTIRNLGMCQKVSHEYEHRDRDHGIALHLVVDLGHGDRDARAAPGEIADDNTGAAEDERKLLTGRKTDDHNQKEYAKQDRAELSCTNAGLRDKIGQHFHHAASPPFVSSAPVADAMMPFTHLSISEMPCSASSVMPTKRASLTGHAGGAHTE